MLKKLMTITTIGLLQVAVYASNENAHTQYDHCMEKVAYFAAQAGQAQTSSEKNHLETAMYNQVNMCLARKSGYRPQETKKYCKCVLGDPATPSYDDVYACYTDKSMKTLFEFSGENITSSASHRNALKQKSVEIKASFSHDTPEC